MRDFTNELVTDEELSTVLWAAYGLRDDGELTVPEINGAHAAVIYVLLEDVYTYCPVNHSLVFYKEGDYRDIVGWQYSAPVQLCLCWNTDIADAISILSHLFAEAPSPSCIDSADANDDGNMDIADAIFILGYLFH